MKKKQAMYLFESSWKKKYTDREIRKILAKYSESAGMTHNLSPHKLWHFLLTWLKNKALMMRSYNRIRVMKSRKSLEVYSKLAITDAQEEYNEVINRLPSHLITSTLRVISASLVQPL
ncbi:integrase [Paenibacillus polymyxa]|nr:integrase [Paenibacillus polymyxa]